LILFTILFYVLEDFAANDEIELVVREQVQIRDPLHGEFRKASIMVTGKSNGMLGRVGAMDVRGTGFF